MISVYDFYSDLKNKLGLKFVAGKNFAKDRKIIVPELNRVGFALTGFYKHFVPVRVQMLGRTESSYIATLNKKDLAERAERLFRQKIPCLVVTLGSSVPSIFKVKAKQYHTPILQTPEISKRATEIIREYLIQKFAPQRSMHGTLLDIFGIGVLVTGESGVGKSETALELIERGHRLVADDIVRIIKVGNSLVGSPATLSKYHMEIRGIGILNIKYLFGVSAVREKKRVELTIHLEPWRETIEYDRLGLDKDTLNILGIDLPRIVMPVRPGRNIPILVEVSAMNLRLKFMGYDSAQEFYKSLNTFLKRKK